MEGVVDYSSTSASDDSHPRPSATNIPTESLELGARQAVSASTPSDQGPPLKERFLIAPNDEVWVPPKRYGGHAAARPEAALGSALSATSSALAPEHASASDGTARPSQLVALNVDVQDQIMWWLPNSSLAALMATCRYFADVALVPLCRRSGKPFRGIDALLSFKAFLRAQHGAIPRWPLIQELTFGEALSTAISPTHVEFWGDGERFLFKTVMEILRLCRNLRVLSLDRWDQSWDSRYVCETVSMLTSLEVLSVSLPHTLAMLPAQDVRKLFGPRLRVFSQSNQYPASDHKVVLDGLKLLSASLTELNLPMVDNWTVSPKNIFPHVRRLTIGFPTINVLTSFPNLAHLSVTGLPPGYNTAYLREHVVQLRESYRVQWRLRPRIWHALLSLKIDHPYTAYVLAVPVRVSFLSLNFRTPTWNDNFRTMLRVIIADANPEVLECRISTSSPAFAASDPDLGNACATFKTLHASSRLTRCIVVIDHPVRYPKERWFNRRHYALMRALRTSLPRLHLTHLLFRYPTPAYDNLPDMSIQGIRERRRGLPALDNRSQRVHPSHDFYDRDMSTGHMRNRMKALVREHVSASPTLRWIGFDVESHSLWSWKVIRFLEPMPPPKLEELDEDSGLAVLAAEGMV